MNPKKELLWGLWVNPIGAQHLRPRAPGEGAWHQGVR